MGRPATGGRGANAGVHTTAGPQQLGAVLPGWLEAKLSELACARAAAGGEAPPLGPDEEEPTGRDDVPLWGPPGPPGAREAPPPPTGLPGKPGARAGGPPPPPARGWYG
mmetsp:Transcript_34023/g.86051  ORF Transcript_34023/g.86051 Transcript_34023/m.86051 type:complete len:109 (-) Transcript_34023:1308-1634(-)